MSSTKPSKTFEIINLVLVFLSCVLVMGLWHKGLASGKDIMFLGFFFFFLFILSMYYLILLAWGFRQLKQQKSYKDHALVLLLLNIFPIVIYCLAAVMSL